MPPAPGTRHPLRLYHTAQPGCLPLLPGAIMIIYLIIMMRCSLKSARSGRSQRVCTSGVEKEEMSFTEEVYKKYSNDYMKSTKGKLEEQRPETVKPFMTGIAEQIRHILTNFKTTSSIFEKTWVQMARLLCWPPVRMVWPHLWFSWRMAQKQENVHKFDNLDLPPVIVTGAAFHPHTRAGQMGRVLPWALCLFWPFWNRGIVLS